MICIKLSNVAETIELPVIAHFVPNVLFEPSTYYLNINDKESPSFGMIAMNLKLSDIVSIHSVHSFLT